MMEDAPKPPHHIAVIMDGNGRWANARGLPRVLGHQAGAQAVRRIVEAACGLGVKALTRLRAIGRLDQIPAGVLSNLRRVIAQTAPFERMTLTLALSYGGRQEIVDAARRLARAARAGDLTPEQIDEAVFAQHLYAPDLRDPDLLIRTSGEQRLSNFLLWQSSYTELYVTSKLWPDFSKEDLAEAIAEYERRDRRFGKVGA
ncbi:MAG: di-trans,poly-cis-decaprenylcistransferase [Candidatus Omnitrophica bacterium]|nr:di-trans,poly-cis-decaprenylcistransferase [Candidatus Omnitrophota bacterium]